MLPLSLCIKWKIRVFFFFWLCNLSTTCLIWTRCIIIFFSSPDAAKSIKKTDQNKAIPKMANTQRGSLFAYPALPVHTTVSLLRFPFYIFCCWPQGTLHFHPDGWHWYGASVRGACVNNYFSPPFFFQSVGACVPEPLAPTNVKMGDERHIHLKIFFVCQSVGVLRPRGVLHYQLHFV